VEEHWKLASNLEREDKCANHYLIIIYPWRKCIVLNLVMSLNNLIKKQKRLPEEKNNNKTELHAIFGGGKASQISPVFFGESRTCDRKPINTASIKQSWG